MPDMRGKVIHRERRRQILDFSNMRLDRNITPTDIDYIASLEHGSVSAMIEYNSRGYVFIETKYNGAKMPYGQELAFRRLAVDLSKVKPTLFLVTTHEVHNPQQDVNLASTVVEMKLKNGKIDPSAAGNCCIDEVRQFIAELEY